MVWVADGPQHVAEQPPGQMPSLRPPRHSPPCGRGDGLYIPHRRASLIALGQQAADKQGVIRESSALRNFALERDRPQQRTLAETSAVAIALALALLTGCSGDDDQAQLANPLVPTSVSDQEQTALIPSDLTLPLLLNEINLRGNINPFGIVRSSKDRAELGHSGIDVPLNTGASIYAVADGQIVSVEPSADARPGSLVKLLIVADQTAGTGWVFLYEHISLLTGLGTNSLVSRGQLIATNPMSPAFGNHLELAYTFNGYLFHSNQSCWVDQLDVPSRSSLLNRFNAELRTDPRFIDSWRTVQFEGKLVFRELLNTTKYPDGARMCYPPGTDERVDP